MNPYIAEFLGTALLVIFGNGVVANVLLNKNKGQNSGWIVITAGWAFAVYVAAFCVAPHSGAHLNPAISIALTAAGKFDPSLLAGYLGAQMLGGILGGCFVFFFYRAHFNATEDPDLKLACFCTAPAIRHLRQAVFCEIIATCLLVLPILLMTDPQIHLIVNGNETTAKVGMGSLGLIPVALLVFAIGLSLGGPTGYAINPARDLGPRIAHSLLPIVNKRDSDWAYAGVPVVGPVFGALLAVGIYKMIVTTPAL